MAEVYLMEDSRPLRRVLAAQLRDAGHNVTSFEDGVASSNSTLIAKADVLVTDIAMPVVGGRQAISNVKLRFPDLPIIAITGELRESLEDLDVFGRLRKPFPDYELIGLVQRALQSRERNRKQSEWPDGIRGEYLAESGAAFFEPVGFLKWLRRRPDHEAYSLCFDADGKALDSMPLIPVRASRR